jgi:hypothetical protein
MKKSYSLFVLPIISLTFNSQTIAVDNPGNDPIQRYYQPAYLFNQDAVLSNPELRNTFVDMGFKAEDLPDLSPNESEGYHTFVSLNTDQEAGINAPLLEREILNEFYKRRRILYLSAIFQEFIGAATLPTLLGLMAGAAQLTHLLQSDYFTSLMIMNAMYTFVTGSYGLKNLVGALLNPSNDCLLPYEIAYAKKKFAINYLDRSHHGIQDLLYPEQLFLVARRSPENFLKTTQFFDILLNMPYTSVQPSVNWDRLKQSLKLYKMESQKLILACCMNHTYSYQKALGFNQAHKELLLLVAPPGAGKSTLVKGMSRDMGLACATICLAGCTVESLEGTPDTPGLLLQKLVELGQRNGVLFLDELDKIVSDIRLLGLILPIIESSTQKFYSPYLRRTVDISHLFIVTAVNIDFNTEELSSMKDRFPKRADLTIINQEEMERILREDYLMSKLTLQERLTFDNESFTNSGQGVDDETNYNSFRQPQGNIDLYLGELRLRRHGII